MKILTLIDSFKGTITSKRLGELTKKVLETKGHCVRPIAISDGGDGFLDAISENIQLKEIKCKVHDPLMRVIETYYLVTEDVAYIELAKASGISLLKESELNPFLATTYGFGEMIKDAISKGYKKIVIGIGGSATDDGGSGMLEALGAMFYDSEGNLLEKMNNEKLASIAKIHIGSVRSLLQDIEVEIYSDVINPLLGENGAVYVFARQKGAKEEDLEVLEANMNHYKNIIEEQVFGINNLSESGEGAAGGVGFAFNRIIRAKMGTGSVKILDLIDFESICKEYDIIITGEGKFDSQSLEGKVITGVMNYNPKRLLIVCGISEIKDDQLEIYSIVPTITSKEESLANPEESLAKLINSLEL